MQLFIRLFIRGKTKRCDCLFICLFTFWYLGTRTPPPVWYKKMAFFAFFVELRGVFSTLKGGVW